MKKKKGFTLIELLVVIIILGIIAGVSIYFGSNAIKNAKEKTYIATVNNIENVASSYIMEEDNTLYYVQDKDNLDNEYQCVTIGELIDLGYFTTDILNSEYSDGNKVKENDYIYLERNIKTKTITSKDFIVSDNENTCNRQSMSKGSVYFSITPGNDTWSQNKNVTLSCKIKNDYNCGNYTLMYKLNKTDEYTEYPGNITVTENTTIYAKIEEIETSENSINVEKIDNTSPTIKVTNQYENKWTNKDVTLTLTATENESGIRNWQYSYDGKTWKAYENSSATEFNYTYKENEDTTIYIRACDNVGNCSEVKSTNIKIDKTAPIISINNSSNSEWTNKTVNLKLEITEKEDSGIKNWQYSSDGKTWNTYSNSNNDNYETTYESTIDTTVYIRACDNAGNCSNTKSTNIKIDKTAPTITITNSSNGAWTNKDVTLTLKAKETESGIKNWQYSYDNSTWSLYDKSNNTDFNYIYKETQTKTVYIKACDNVGNCSSSQSTNIKIDKTKPNIPTITLSNYNIFKYSSTDNESGIKGYYVSQNSSSKGEMITSTSKTVSTAGSYYIWAVDNAGNISNSSTINAYTLTIIEGTGTTLKVLKDSTSLASKSVILAGTNLTVYGELKTGYNTLTIKNNNNEIKNNNTIKVTNNITLTSSAKVNNVTITFDYNDGVTSQTTISKKVGEEYGTLPSPLRTNYIFDGWYTEKSNGTKVTKSTIAKENITIYAHWKSSVTSCDADFGNVIASYTIKYDEKNNKTSITIDKIKLYIKGLSGIYWYGKGGENCYEYRAGFFIAGSNGTTLLKTTNGSRAMNMCKGYFGNNYDTYKNDMISSEGWIYLGITVSNKITPYPKDNLEANKFTASGIIPDSNGNCTLRAYWDRGNNKSSKSFVNKTITIPCKTGCN